MRLNKYFNDSYVDKNSGDFYFEHREPYLIWKSRKRIRVVNRLNEIASTDEENFLDRLNEIPSIDEEDFLEGFHAT